MGLLAHLSLCSSRKGLARFQFLKLLSICPACAAFPDAPALLGIQARCMGNGSSSQKTLSFFPSQLPLPTRHLGRNLSASPGSTLKSEPGTFRVPRVKFQGTHSLKLALHVSGPPPLHAVQASKCIGLSLLPQHRPCFVVLIDFPSVSVGYLPLQIYVTTLSQGCMCGVFLYVFFCSQGSQG